MGKPVKSDVEKVETKQFGTQINKEVLKQFKDYCKYKGYSMNMMLETFMLQYNNGKFILTEEEVKKWYKDVGEVEDLNTTLNKEISLKFKTICKERNYFFKYVLTAFMYKLINENYILEFVEADDN